MHFIYIIFVIIISYCNCIFAAVITLKNRTSSFCLITDDDVYNAVISKRDPLKKFQINQDEGIYWNENWKDQNWKPANWFIHNFQPIFDHRWNNFTANSKNENGIGWQGNMSHFSVCSSGPQWSFQIFSNKSFSKKITVSVNQTGVARKEPCSWNHYTLKLKENLILLIENKKTIKKYPIKFLPGRMGNWIPNATFWKIQHYNYYWSDAETKNNSATIIPVQSQENGNFCISLYYSLDEGSTLEIYLESNNATLHNETIKGFNKENEEKSWHRKSISAKGSEKGFLNISRKFDDPTREKGFWAIDQIEYCYNVTELIPMNNTEAMCMKLTSSSKKACHNIDNYYWSDGETKNNSATIIPVQSQENGNFCISLYYSLDEGSNLEITLESNNWTLRNETMKGFNKENEEKSWHRKSISAKGSGNGFLYISRKFDDPTREKGFWAIAQIEYCHNLAELIPMDSIEDMCMKLTPSSKNTCQKSYKFGELCNIRCAELFPGNPTCRGFHVSQEDQQFECAFGYHGHSCEEEIPTTSVTIPSTTTNKSNNITDVTTIDSTTTLRKLTPKKEIRGEEEQEKEEEDIVDSQSSKMNTALGILFGILLVEIIVCAVVILWRNGYLARLTNLRQFLIDIRIEVRRDAERQEELSSRFLRPGSIQETSYQPEQTFYTEEPYQETHYNAVNEVELQLIIKELHEDTFKLRKFIQNIKAIPLVTTKSCDIALSEGNSKKNRHTAYMPYDYNRVVMEPLEGISGNDYINASYIKDFAGDQKYIACQAPKYSTMSDFWRMIWQQNVALIIMATNFYEMDIHTCTEYFPRYIGAKAKFESIEITLKSHDCFEHHDIRSLEVTYRKIKRTIRHVHLKWNPDNREPLYPNYLHNIVKILMGTPKIAVIHCNNGVDRTGCIILCVLAMQMYKNSKCIDFQMLMTNLRDERPYMVQSDKQFILAHLVVQELLFAEKKQDLFKNESSCHKLKSKKFVLELENLSKVTIHDRLVQKLSLVETRHPLGLFVNSYGSTNQFIVAQKLENNSKSTSEFWAMVLQEKINLIVFLDKQIDVPCCEVIRISMRESLMINLVNTIHWDTHQELGLEIKNSLQNETPHRVIVIKLKKSFKNYIPTSVESFVQVLLHVLEKYSECDGPILLGCCNGLSTCGLFAATFYLINQFRKELDYNIRDAVRTIRRSGIDFIQNKEQLRFLYEAMIYYTTKIDPYTHID